MIFRTYQPRRPLSEFVVTFWFYAGGGLPHRRERVLPDGTAELVINLDDVPRKRFDRANPRRYETVRRAWISGPQPEYTVIDVLPRATMMGVHFKPGGVAPFVPMPAGELGGKLVELELLWGAAAGDLRDELLEVPNIQGKFQRLEQFLFQQALRPLCPDPLVSRALHSLLHTAAFPSVQQVASEVGLSHKQFIERFRAAVGLTPKRLCRIHRFQRTLAEMRARREVDWADVAAGGGYYDQAHMIQDFRAFSGLTPGCYLGQGGADERFVPILD